MEEGIAFPMILAILFAYYRTENPKKKRRVILLSVIIGFVCAAISAYIRSIPNYINRANLSYYSMIPVIIALILFLTLIAFGKKIASKNNLLYENLMSAAVSIYAVTSFLYYMPSFFLQVNGFVYYGESIISTMVLHRFAGFLFAVFIIILSVIAIYNTGIKLSSNKLTKIVVIGLLIRSVSQIAVILNRLYSLKIIPKNPTLFTVLAWIQNNTGYLDFIVMGFFIIAPIMLWGENIKITQTYRNRAELRKIRYNMKNMRKLAAFFIVVMIFNMLSLSVIKSYANREIPLSAPENYEIKDGIISIPLEDFEDGHLHRYEYQTSDGKALRFIVIKKSQGSYGVGLDACEICGPSGYFERNDQVVCKLCDVVMNKGTIGFKGGCNPIPFPYIVHDKKLKIETKTLDGFSYVFK